VAVHLGYGADIAPRPPNAPLDPRLALVYDVAHFINSKASRINCAESGSFTASIGMRAAAAGMSLALSAAEMAAMICAAE
jgi:hypothetical protein